MARWYLLLAAIAALSVALVTPVLLSRMGSDTGPAARSDPVRGLPPYWTVSRGDSYTAIARKTGLTVEDLVTFNPYTDPDTIVPGQKLKLRLHVPPPRPRPKGPVWITVRSGDTFDSVAAKTGHSAEQLQRRNPRLHATTLQPGDRMRLRR